MLEQQFLNKSKFSKLIEKTVCDKAIGYMEAILLLCDKHNIDPEDVRKFVSPIIRNKLEAEAMTLNLLPKVNALDSSLFE